MGKDMGRMVRKFTYSECWDWAEGSGKSQALNIKQGLRGSYSYSHTGI